MSKEKKSERKNTFKSTEYDERIKQIEKFQRQYFAAAETYKNNGSKEVDKNFLDVQLSVLVSQMDFLARDSQNPKVQESVNLFKKRIEQHYNAVVYPKDNKAAHYGVKQYATVAKNAVKEAITQTKEAANPAFSANLTRRIFGRNTVFGGNPKKQDRRNKRLDAFLTHPAQAPLLFGLPKAAKLMKAGFSGKTSENRSNSDAFNWDQAANNYLQVEAAKLEPKPSVLSSILSGIANVGLFVLALVFRPAGWRTSSEQPKEENVLRAEKAFVEETLEEVEEGLKRNPGNPNLTQAKLMLEHVSLRLDVRMALTENTKYVPAESDPKFENVRKALDAHKLLSQQGAPAHVIEKARSVVERQVEKANGSFLKDLFTSEKDLIDLKETSNLAKYGAKAPMGLSAGLKQLMRRGFGEVKVSQRNTFDSGLVMGLLKAKNTPTETLDKLLLDADRAIELNGQKNSTHLIEIRNTIINLKEQRLAQVKEPLQALLTHERWAGLSKGLTNTLKSNLNKLPTTEVQIQHLELLRTQIQEHKKNKYVERSPEDQKKLKAMDHMLEKGINARKSALAEYKNINAATGMTVNQDKTHSYLELAKMSKEQLNVTEQRVDRALKLPLVNTEKSELFELRQAITQTREANLNAVPKELKELYGEVKGGKPVEDKHDLKARLQTKTKKELDVLKAQAKTQLKDSRISSSSDSKLIGETVSLIEKIEDTAQNRYQAVMDEAKDVKQLSNEQLKKLYGDLSKLGKESEKRGSEVYCLPNNERQKISQKMVEIQAVIQNRQAAIPAEVKPFLSNSDYIKPQLQNKKYNDLVDIRNKAKNEAKIPHHFKTDRARLGKVAQAVDETLETAHQHVVSLTKRATGKSEIRANDNVEQMTKDYLKNATNEQLQKLYDNAQQIIDQKPISKKDQDNLHSIRVAIVAIQQQRKAEEKQGATIEKDSLQNNHLNNTVRTQTWTAKPDGQTPKGYGHEKMKKM